LQLFGIDTGIGNDWPIRQRRRSDAAADPQILCAVLFDLLTTDGDGGNGGSAILIHREPRLLDARMLGEPNPTDFPPIKFASVRGLGRFLLAVQRGNFPRTFGANA
jgi:hypothetical protein